MTFHKGMIWTGYEKVKVLRNSTGARSPLTGAEVTPGETLVISDAINGFVYWRDTHNNVQFLPIDDVIKAP